jgi:hypothetical protein
MANVHSRVTGAGFNGPGDVEFTVSLPDSDVGDVITVYLTATQVNEEGQLSAMAGGSLTFTQSQRGGSVPVVADVPYTTVGFNPARAISVQTQAVYGWASYLVPTPEGPQTWTVKHLDGESPSEPGTS